MDTQLSLRAPLQPGVIDPVNIFERFRTWMSALWVDHAIFRLWFNTPVRIVDGFYRSSHPLPHQLRAVAEKGVRTVVNLRGNDPAIAPNRLEWEACKALGLEVVHFPMRSRDAPEVEELLGLEALFRSMKKPVLIHCKSGADRAGLVSAIYLMVCEGASPALAMKQMGFWRFGHVKMAKTGVLDHFLSCYAAARARSGITFMDWVRTEYDRDAVLHSFRGTSVFGRIVDAVLGRE